MKYYLTTPIYYVNATPHIGHTYTTLVADTVKRFRRMMGDDVHLVTGTDEHGQKVEAAGRNAGWEPRHYADRVSGAFRRQWDELDIGYDDFVRTTEPRHARAVQWLFSLCKEKGAIYKGSYTGQYCSNCELYVNDAEPGSPCPDCGRPTETVTEENYFFKLSEYQDKLLKFYEEHPEFIRPESRRNEVLSFVRGGLRDLSISRSNLKWGIPLPGDEGHVFYVWFDALTNYMTALGYGDEHPEKVDPNQRWPADLHLVGKEIVRFHAVYWPAFLMAAELPLPKQVFAHGWLIFQEHKMSKSRGNVVRASPIGQVMGIESLRYYLLREIVFGNDGNFSYDALVERYNSDLANGLGNLVSRTLAMIHRYFEGQVPASPSDGGEIAKTAAKTITQTTEHFENFEFSRGLEAIWAMLGSVDKYIVERKPWVLAKNADAESRAALRETLYSSAEVLRISCVLLHPVMPKATAAIWKQLSQETPLDQVRLSDVHWGQLREGIKVGAATAAFPRLDVKETVETMKELEKETLQEQAEIMGKQTSEPLVETSAEATGSASSTDTTPEPAADAATEPAAPQAAPAEPPPEPKIDFEDFMKVEMRVGEVKSAERVPKTDRLLHLMVDIGEAEPRSIVAGIAEAYEPESLIGRKVVIVANLKPRKMRGVESNGMIVAASLDGGKPVLAGFHEDVPAGASLR
jgi:methionyl-tRNA synthetase